MKRFFTLCAVCLLLAGALLLSGCAETQPADTDYTVRVLLPDSDEYDFHGSQIVENGMGVGEISDQKYQDVRPGQSVRFAITAADGLRIISKTDGIFYEDGFLTVENVRVPTTLSV